MRLIGGETEYEATLLLCINNAWGTLCRTNGWNDVEAQVACNNLGYKSQGATYYIANLGNLLYPIFTRDFSCTLTENSLYNCSHISSSDDTHCGTHYYDVGLKCEGKYLSSVLEVLHFACKVNEAIGIKSVHCFIVQVQCKFMKLPWACQFG